MLMDPNAFHYAVEVLSADWWMMNFAWITALCFLLYYTKNKSEDFRNKVGKYIGTIMLLNFVAGQLNMIGSNSWNISTSLPLQLCSLSVFLSIYLMFSKSQWVYEILLCWSAGAIHSFITPELTTGRSVFKLIDYTISHGGILVAGIYATTRLSYSPRAWSWLKILAITQLTLPTVGVLNFLIDSNYMYLRHRPLANNPFLIGEWPYYLIGLQAAALLHFFLIIKLHQWLAKKTAGYN